MTLLSGTADRQRVDTVCVAVTIAVIAVLTTVARRPHEDRPETTTTLHVQTVSTTIFI